MSICFYNEDVIMPLLKFGRIKKCLKNEVISHQCTLGAVNYIFCSDDYLLALNTKFLQHDYYTDVITFDYTQNTLVAGDIYISTDRVLNNSFIFKVEYEEELVRVICHGLLHLLNFGDKEKDEIDLMRRKEYELIHAIFSFQMILLH